jgi:outer membrane lipoprotein-sorting protein
MRSEGQRVRRSLLALVGALVGAVISSGIVLGERLSSAQAVLDAMKEKTQAIETLDARITITTYNSLGKVGLVQRMRVSLLQPDSMRQEYIEPDFFAGNLTLIVGKKLWIYIAANTTWYSKDLSDLSPGEEPWLLFRQILRGVRDELDDYDFQLLADETTAYHLIGKAATSDATYGTIEVWVDPDLFVPTRRLVYDVDDRLLVDGRLLEIDVVDGVAPLAQRIETYDETGALKNVIQYDSLVLNGGLDPALFEPPQG